MSKVQKVSNTPKEEIVTAAEVVPQISTSEISAEDSQAGQRRRICKCWC